jgi:hypothetical protein
LGQSPKVFSFFCKSQSDKSCEGGLFKNKKARKGRWSRITLCCWFRVLGWRFASLAFVPIRSLVSLCVRSPISRFALARPRRHRRGCVVQSPALKTRAVNRLFPPFFGRNVARLAPSFKSIPVIFRRSSSVGVRAKRTVSDVSCFHA